MFWVALHATVKGALYMFGCDTNIRTHSEEYTVLPNLGTHAHVPLYGALMRYTGILRFHAAGSHQSKGILCLLLPRACTVGAMLRGHMGNPTKVKNNMPSWMKSPTVGLPILLCGVLWTLQWYVAHVSFIIFVQVDEQSTHARSSVMVFSRENSFPDSWSA